LSGQAIARSSREVGQCILAFTENKKKKREKMSQEPKEWRKELHERIENQKNKHSKGAKQRIQWR